MEISDIKRLVVDTIDRARRQAAERRTRTDEASAAYALFLERTAVPVFRQISNVLRSEGYPFTVFTPGGSVRLASDRSAEDYIELSLDTTGERPMVAGHARHSRGRHIVDREHPLGEPAALAEIDIVTFVLKELEPLVER